jgi:hypothetical protein
MTRRSFTLGIILPLLLCILLPTSLHGQDDPPPPEKKAPPRTLRLLPLGEPPPFRQEIRDGVRYELEPPPGSIPPRLIRLGLPETEESAPPPEQEPTRLNLGRIGEPMKIPAGKNPLILREGDSPDDPEAKPWLRITPPETGNILAIIWRDPGTTWATPRAITFPESAAAFPAGNVRLLNLTPADIGIQLNQKRILLKPGKSVLQAIPQGADLPIEVSYNDGTGNFVRLHSSSVLLNPGERCQVIIHRADSEKPRRPVRVSFFNEMAPVPPPPAP